MTNVYSDNGVSTADVAQAVMRTLAMGQPVAPATKGNAPTFATVAAGLEALVQASPALRSALEQVLGTALRQTLAATGAAVPALDSVLSMFKSGQVGAQGKGGTVVEAFWWGFHIKVSHDDLQTFIAAGSTVNTIVGAIGGGIPSPAAPFITLAATFVAGALGLLKSLDHGSGVYISMSWFAPGAFVPTSV